MVCGNDGPPFHHYSIKYLAVVCIAYLQAFIPWIWKIQHRRGMARENTNMKMCDRSIQQVAIASLIPKCEKVILSYLSHLLKSTINCLSFLLVYILYHVWILFVAAVAWLVVPFLFIYVVDSCRVYRKVCKQSRWLNILTHTSRIFLFYSFYLCTLLLPCLSCSPLSGSMENNHNVAK